VGAIQQTRYDRLLRRTTAQYGGGSKLGEALEDLFPVMEVEDTPSELLRATGWILGAGQGNRAPAVGTKASIQLFNPAGSGNLVVLTDLFIGMAATTRCASGPSFSALTRASTPGQQRDTRNGELRRTVGLIQDEDDGLVSNLLNVQVIANETLHVQGHNDVAVLAPGSGWRVTTAVDDVTLRLSFFWRERVAQPEELDF